MRSGLHNIGEGFTNGLVVLLHTIEQGFVRAAPTPAAGDGDALLLETGDKLLKEDGDDLLLED